MANLRFALGMLALAKKYGMASTDDACAMALETAPANTASRAAIWNESPTAVRLTPSRSADPTQRKRWYSYQSNRA